jgi:hypothetical protein
LYSQGKPAVVAPSTGACAAALAPHQIDATVIAAFRARWPADSALLGALAWPSFTAARRIGTWLDVQDRRSRGAV